MVEDKGLQPEKLTQLNQQDVFMTARFFDEKILLKGGRLQAFKLYRHCMSALQRKRRGVFERFEGVLSISDGNRGEVT